MHTHAVALVALLAALLAVAHGWAHVDDYEMSPSRRSWCVGSGNKCYATDQCCKGFVCAAFDDLFERKSVEGLNPEIPGYCVREKDLQPCMTSAECPDDSKCLALGRAKTRYCVPRPEMMPDDRTAGKSNSAFAKSKNGLGGPCEDDTDCKTFTTDGKDRLCCQDIRRYRQKPKRVCDRITPISSCIPSKK